MLNSLVDLQNVQQQLVSVSQAYTFCTDEAKPIDSRDNACRKGCLCTPVGLFVVHELMGTSDSLWIWMYSFRHECWRSRWVFGAIVVLL